MKNWYLTQKEAGLFDIFKSKPEKTKLVDIGIGKSIGRQTTHQEDLGQANFNDRTNALKKQLTQIQITINQLKNLVKTDASQHAKLQEALHQQAKILDQISREHERSYTF
jgi:septal ring factor EnvC (AmiA/AmiB activator)